MQDDPFCIILQGGKTIRAFYLFLRKNLRKKLSFTSLYKWPSTLM